MGEILANSQQGTEEVFWEGEVKNNDDSSATVKLLPRLALRVLLVEADDSTRQIITALLRKCSYRVAAVSDGLKAWETLKGKPHEIDLILTEVELPSISGFALLTLIMEHKICKNIPVIMMSSHDSISMAYKCMLRGAADFLIKPVRRNELRNLWQHTWRRQASTGGGHFTQEGSIAQRKAETTSETTPQAIIQPLMKPPQGKGRNAVKRGVMLNSCTRPELEAESAYIQNMQGFLPQKCAQSLLLHASNEKDYEECVKMDQKFLRHNIEAGDTGSVLQDTHACMEKMTDGEDLCTESQREDANITSVTHEDNSESLECSREAIDLIGALDSNPKYACGHRSSNYSSNKLGSSSLLELSLRRTHHSLSDNLGSDEKHILNHSNASAFSWYNNRISQPLYLTSASFCAEPKTNASNSQKHFCSQVPSYVVDTSQWKCLIQTTPGSMNSVVTGESGEAETALPCPPLGVVPVQGVRFDSLFAGHGAVLPPIFCTQSYAPPVCELNSGSQQEPSFQFNSSHQSNLETQISEQVHHPFDQNVNNSSNQTRQEQDHNLGSFEDSSQVSPATAQSANSSFCNSTVSHLNTSGCGSVSNGNNSSLTLAAAGRAAAESTKDESLFIQDGLKGMDSHRFTQREAALTKFRLKRKDRCYEKKVRYQSRKRLAEQRPRVKGQFVRQAQIDPIC